MTQQNNKAFTLVELIVVITILAVLATVAFISFQSYTSSSRDSVRLADLKNISKSFEINRTKDIDFPLPDKKVDISSSGTIFQYQWELSQNILNSDLNIFDGGLDPVTKKPYGYAVNIARNKFQIIWFLENQESVANIYQNTVFADNSDKYVKSSGDNLGILLDETTNEIIVQSGSLNEIDVDTNTDNYILAFWKNVIIWEWIGLKKQFEANTWTNTNCLTILRSGLSKGNGIYTINPTWIDWEEFEVFCDMQIDWWGWTRIIYADNQEATINTQGETGGVTGTGKLSDEKINKIIYDGVDMLFDYKSNTKFVVNNIDSWTWDSLNNQTIHLYDLWAKGIHCLGSWEFWEYTQNSYSDWWASTFIRYNPDSYNLYFPNDSRYGYSARRWFDTTSGSICWINKWTTTPQGKMFMR